MAKVKMNILNDINGMTSEKKVRNIEWNAIMAIQAIITLKIMAIVKSINIVAINLFVKLLLLNLNLIIEQKKYKIIKFIFI